MPDTSGYRGRSLKALKGHGVSVGDLIAVHTPKGVYEGVLMPRYEYDDDLHIVIKLKNGYNVGVSVEGVERLARIAGAGKPAFTPPPRPSVKPGLPPVAIISTGGTIASRVDYRTGGVYPALTAEDLYLAVPELLDHAHVSAEVLFSILSEHIAVEHWSAMARKVEEKVREGFRGVVIAHGTDTMGYTSAALSFALKGVPVPVILVGAQRSSDRPSSDAASNLIGAVAAAAYAPFSGVYVAMHAGMGDDRVAVHLGTRVRKSHTSRRDAFESVDVPLAAIVRGRAIKQILPNLPTRRDSRGFQAKPRFDERVALVKYHPGFDPGVIDFLVDRGCRGIVFEGTGLGHVGKTCYESIRRAAGKGVLMGMTSQCIWGRVRMTVYATGRDLLSMGVLPLGGMLSETALVKMMWVLANADGLQEAESMMLENLAGEFPERSPPKKRFLP